MPPRTSTRARYDGTQREAMGSTRRHSCHVPGDTSITLDGTRLPSRSQTRTADGNAGHERLRRGECGLAKHALFPSFSGAYTVHVAPSSADRLRAHSDVVGRAASSQLCLPAPTDAPASPLA